MPKRYRLMKCEPAAYTIDDLARDGDTSWEGVRNFQARNFMRDEMRGQEMPRKRYAAEQIITKLRQAEVEIARDQPITMTPLTCVRQPGAGPRGGRRGVSRGRSSERPADVRSVPTSAPFLVTRRGYEPLRRSAARPSRLRTTDRESRELCRLESAYPNDADLGPPKYRSESGKYRRFKPNQDQARAVDVRALAERHGPPARTCRVGRQGARAWPWRPPPPSLPSTPPTLALPSSSRPSHIVESTPRSTDARPTSPCQAQARRGSP